MVKMRRSRVATTGTAILLCLGLVTTGTSIVTAGATTKHVVKVPGVTARQVTIGATVPLTGIASAGYSDTAKAANAVFKYINSKGGVSGRKINYVLKDDCYGTPGFGCTGVPNTATQTKALLALPVFATVGSLGTPTQDSVRSLLKANKVPQLFVNSGSTDWNNTSVYPGLFGWQINYHAEGKIFAQYIKATYPTANTCFLGQADDFGSDGLAGILAGGIAPSDTQLYKVSDLVTSSGASVGPYIAKFQADKCDVVVLYSIPGATDAVLGAALKLGYSPHWVISNVGSDPVTVDQPFAKAPFPDPEIGAVSFSYLHTTVDTGQPWLAWTMKVLTADQKDFPGFGANSIITGNMANGIGWGVSFVEALKAAGKNFTRASFLKTLTSTTFSQTPSLTPLRYTPGNHQGLNGGFLTIVKSSTAVAPLDGKIYTTDATNSGPIKPATSLSSGIPSWLK
jgi:branched-chain amino acid transport system substrate-binding protein